MLTRSSDKGEKATPSVERRTLPRFLYLVWFSIQLDTRQRLFSCSSCSLAHRNAKDRRVSKHASKVQQRKTYTRTYSAQLSANILFVPFSHSSTVTTKYSLQAARYLLLECTVWFPLHAEKEPACFSRSGFKLPTEGEFGGFQSSHFLR